MDRPVLSEYLNYRLYLRDFYEYKRKTHRGIRAYSYSVFSASADIKSPTYLKLIIEAQRNLGEEMISKFSLGLGHSREEAEEFFLLVKYGQSTDPALRHVYLKKLSELRVKHQISKGQVDKEAWEKVPGWVSWVLYALVDVEGVSFDKDRLRSLLRGRATESEIESALQKLLASGDLLRDENSGDIRRSTTKKPESVPVELVRKLQGDLMYLGLESLFHDDPLQREFGSLTLALTQKEFEELKFRLRKMKKEIQKDNFITRMDSKGERLYQLNMQLYPLTE